MSDLEGASAKNRPYWPSFGECSLALAVLAFAVTWGAGSAMKELEPDFRAIVAYGSVALVTAVAIFGFVLGVLSLFGYGKVRGSSHRVVGFLGLILCGFYACTPLLLIPAMSAARAAKEKAESAEANKLSRVVLRDEQLVLSKPGPGWILAEGEQAKRMNPLAVASALRPVEDSDQVVGGIILVEVVQDPAVLTADLTAIAEYLAESSEWKDKTINHTGEGTWLGIPCGEVSLAGTSPGGRARLQIKVFIREGRVVQLFAFGPEAKTDPAGADFAPFFKAVTLLDDAVEPR